MIPGEAVHGLGLLGPILEAGKGDVVGVGCDLGKGPVLGPTLRCTERSWSRFQVIP